VQEKAFLKSHIMSWSEEETHGLKVLVVDDEAIIRETLASYLNFLGVSEIHSASNGKEATLLLVHESYDYVFMDLMMPEMGGMEVLKELNLSGKPTSVIVMTGYPSMEKVIEAMRYGASDFLIKPFKLQDVKLSMERIKRLHQLMKNNWLLNQELEQKRQVEKLNDELQRQIREKSLLYDIIDSFSKISLSEDLYGFLVKKAAEACNAKKACFLIYDQSKGSLLVFTSFGIPDLSPGTSVIIRTRKGSGEIEPGFIKKFMALPNPVSIPTQRTCCLPDLVSVPFTIRGEYFGVLMVSNKKKGRNFDKRDEFLLNFMAEKAALNVENMALYHSLKENLFATLGALVSAIEARDRYTQEHSTRVTRLALDIARCLGCKPDDLRRLESSGPLHDIGKIGIDDHILKKPGKLTEEEYNNIKMHPLIGVNIVSHLGLDKEELAIIRNHHERWDGRGYPDQLKGKEIPRLARILSVADAFDAMNSDRAYRYALPFETCLKELEQNKGKQFDPEVVEAAIHVLTH